MDIFSPAREVSGAHHWSLVCAALPGPALSTYELNCQERLSPLPLNKTPQEIRHLKPHPY